MIDEVVGEAFPEERSAVGDGARVDEIDAREVARRGDAAGFENRGQQIERAHRCIA